MTHAITDFSRFVEMRKDAVNGEAGALDKAAQQFEAMFVETLLKSMRATTPGNSLLGNGNDAQLYQQLFDQQMAENIASGPGIGLAELLTRQMGSEFSSLQSAAPAPAVPRAPITAASGAGPKDNDITPMEFTRKLWPYASRAAGELGVSPKAVLAQAALETGWGRRAMQTDTGSASHNYFGIKADASWQGDIVQRQTLEYRDGAAERENARFRAYDSQGAAFTDYVEFLTGNPRYSGVAGHGDDVAGFAASLQSAGYATDPAYADKIAAIASGDTMRQAVAGLKFGGLTPTEQ